MGSPAGASAALDRLQRAAASRRRDRGAGALGNQPPGITLVIDLCGRGARRSGTGGAVVHALERDAVALLLAGRLGEGRRADGGKGGGQRAGQRQRQCGGFGINGSRLLLLDARSERAAIKQRRVLKVKCRYTIVLIVADYG